MAENSGELAALLLLSRAALEHNNRLNVVKRGQMAAAQVACCTKIIYSLTRAKIT